MAVEPDLGETQAEYANYFQIGFSAVEFVLDFGRQFADMPARVHARVVTNPAHAKSLCELLERSIREYCEQFGGIAGCEDS